MITLEQQLAIERYEELTDRIHSSLQELKYLMGTPEYRSIFQVDLQPDLEEHQTSKYIEFDAFVQDLTYRTFEPNEET